MNPRRRNAALIALLLTGCSQSETVRDSAATVPPTTSATTSTTTSTTTTTIAATTIASTSTTTSTTIASSTTVLPLQAAQAVDAASAQPKPATLPVPLPPPDPLAPEAVVELGSIEIPRLGVSKSFFEGITLSTLNRGPGHWPGTALPGAVGNVVVGGHRTSKSRPFRHLERLVPGDEVIFTTGAGRFVYRVVRTEIVTPESMWIINQTEAYTATLFACNPVGSTKERIVVFLELGV